VNWPAGLSNSPAAHFYYVAGCVFSIVGISLAGFSFAAVIWKPAGSRFNRWGRTITYVFLVLALTGFSAYVWEAVAALGSANPYEHYLFIRNRLGGPYAWAYWLHVSLALLPQSLWLPRLRGRPLATLLIVGPSLLPTALERLIVGILRFHSL